MHEIVTIQIGQQSNYVGTHFWNTQESYFTYTGQDESPVNHDIHFRAGIGADGTDTFTPRTVIYDFKGAFGTLKRINELYEVLGDDRSQRSTWYDQVLIRPDPLARAPGGGNTTTQRMAPVELTDYQRSLAEGLEPPSLNVDNVRYWSDFNRVYHHPRSVVQIYETDVNPEQRSFDNWQVGDELYTTLDKEHDLFDRDVRPFVEECDQMQGLQMLTCIENGWGGFSARYIDRLRDEFGKTSIWVWALGEGQAQAQTNSRRAAKILNEALALAELSSQASVYIPLTADPCKLPSYISLNRNSQWHTSAIQATAFESLTLPSRLRPTRATRMASLDELAAAISLGGERNIAQLQFELSGLDIPMQSDPCDLFPQGDDARVDRRVRTFAEVDVYRGDLSEAEPSGNGYHDDSAEEQEFQRFEVALPFPILDSFPHIYPLETRSAKAVSVRTRVRVSSSTTEWIKSLETASRRRVSVEDREALSNGLKEISEAYETRTDSDDEEWDD